MMMGVQSSMVLKWVVFLVFFCVCLGQSTIAFSDTICDVQGCNCTKKAAAWKVVNCTLNSSQDVDLGPKFVPAEVMEIFISGGNLIIISSKSFHLLTLSLLYIDGAEKIVMEKQSFFDIISPSLTIQIQNCDQLIIKTGAFENMESAIVSEITRCATVSIEKLAFNKLHSAKFQDIPQLTLATGSFEFRNQGNIGKHGPVTIISFDNVIIPRIPHHTFYSSLAEINIKNTEIHEIYDEAFSANQISAISIVNSTINFLKTGAFIEKTLIFDFKMSRCRISMIETKAITAGIGNLTVQHSRITDIEKGAINSTAVNVEITGNEIANFNSYGFNFQNWNKIRFDQNIIKQLQRNFLVAPSTPNVQEFTFNNNEVQNVDPGAFSIVQDLDDKIFNFDNNYFDQTCHCLIDEWIIELITVNQTSKIKKIMNNTFCHVNDLLTQCFNLTNSIINIRNFTKLVCNQSNTIICDTYNGETKFVNTTSKLLTNNNNLKNSTNWLMIIIVCTSFLTFAIVITFILLLIRGSRWLKRKGYFRKIQYNNQNEASNEEEENTIVTVDENEIENDKLEIPEELTIEFLQELSKKLDDPNTHQQASEMIERLYEMFIVDDSYENNNRNDDEAHLYEELGNLQQQSQQQSEQNQTRSILRLMEEKFNLHTENDNKDENNLQPKLIGEYSEPSDAAVHLYSELKQNKDDKSDNDTIKSKNSMAFRPLPDKPGSSKMSN